MKSHQQIEQRLRERWTYKEKNDLDPWIVFNWNDRDMRGQCGDLVATVADWLYPNVWMKYWAVLTGSLIIWNGRSVDNLRHFMLEHNGQLIETDFVQWMSPREYKRRGGQLGERIKLMPFIRWHK